MQFQLFQTNLLKIIIVLRDQNDYLHIILVTNIHYRRFYYNFLVWLFQRSLIAKKLRNNFLSDYSRSNPHFYLLKYWFNFIRSRDFLLWPIVFSRYELYLRLQLRDWNVIIIWLLDCSLGGLWIVICLLDNNKIHIQVLLMNKM